MKSMIKVCFLAFCYWSCTYQHAPMNQHNVFRLSDMELNQLVELLDTSERSGLNFHILYSEQLNDSTGIVRVWQNQFKANRNLGLCKISRVKQGYIFLYDSISCKEPVPDSLASSKEGSPIFIIHSPQWMILAKRRQGEMIYYKIALFTKYDETLKVPEDMFEN